MTQHTQTQAIQKGSTSRLLLAGGVIGPVLFTTIYLIEGATRPGAHLDYDRDVVDGPSGYQASENYQIAPREITVHRDHITQGSRICFSRFHSP